MRGHVCCLWSDIFVNYIFGIFFGQVNISSLHSMCSIITAYLSHTLVFHRGVKKIHWTMDYILVWNNYLAHCITLLCKTIILHNTLQTFLLKISCTLHNIFVWYFFCILNLHIMRNKIILHITLHILCNTIVLYNMQHILSWTIYYIIVEHELSCI